VASFGKLHVFEMAESTPSTAGALDRRVLLAREVAGDDEQLADRVRNRL